MIKEELWDLKQGLKRPDWKYRWLKLGLQRMGFVEEPEPEDSRCGGSKTGSCSRTLGVLPADTPPFWALFIHWLTALCKPAHRLPSTRSPARDQALSPGTCPAWELNQGPLSAGGHPAHWATPARAIICLKSLLKETCVTPIIMSVAPKSIKNWSANYTVKQIRILFANSEKMIWNKSWENMLNGIKILFLLFENYLLNEIWQNM